MQCNKVIHQKQKCIAIRDEQASVGQFVARKKSMTDEFAKTTPKPSAA